MALDAKGGFLLESRGAAARVFAHEDHDGGLFFEVAMERGSRIFVSKTVPEQSRSQICTISPERTS